MKKYFAWVFFVLGAINVIATGTAVDSAIVLFDAIIEPTWLNVLSFVWRLCVIAIFAVFFRLWWKWK